MQIVFNIKAKNSEHARVLLEKLGMPFERSN
jgi:ribosomal protein L5